MAAIRLARGALDRENMSDESHDTIAGREITMRDRLAIDRTVLANERTVLAYGRTGLALIVVGGWLIRLEDSHTWSLAGWLFGVAGGLVIVVGLWRFLSVRRSLNALSRRAAAATDPTKDADPS